MGKDDRRNAGTGNGGAPVDSTIPRTNVEPEEFLRALLNIDPADAETAREAAARHGTKSDENPR